MADRRVRVRRRRSVATADPYKAERALRGAMRHAPSTLDRDALEASVCRDSFREFVRRFWDTVIPEDMVWNWHMDVLCDELQTVAERVFKGEPSAYDLIINISPGTTKSTICSVMFPAWVWTRMPSARSICASYAHALAMDLSRRCRDVIRSDKWRRLFPDVSLRYDQDTKSYFINTVGGSRYCVGTEGAVTGQHAHFLMVDDPLNPLEAISEVELKAANRWLAETFTSRKVDKRITPTILIMQRLHQADPSADMLERAREKGLSVRHINLPAEVSPATYGDVQPPELLDRYTEVDHGIKVMDPTRLGLDVLKKERAKLGEYGYAGQYLQRPVPLGGGMFKVDRITVDVPRGGWRQRVRYWDKAGTGGGGAYTVGVLMGVDRGGRYWILDVVRGQWESSEREQRILQTAQLDGKKVIVGVEQEPGSAGKESAQNTLRNLAGFRVRLDKPTGDKITRADPFSVQVNGGNVSMVKAMWAGVYTEELQYFPHSRYKDQVDASSGAFALLTKHRIRVGGL